MNIALWILQTLLALHTAIGALWKFSNSEHAVPSLNAIPHRLWLSLGVCELLLSVALILPAFNKSLSILAPVAAVGIAAEMLLFCAVHVRSDASSNGPVFYWVVVVVIAALIAYGRLALKPL